MSWFNTAHLSVFAKQAFTQAQRSIDRVLDIQEEEEVACDGGPLGDTPQDVTETPSTPGSGNWTVTEWGLTSTPTASHELAHAITTPISRVLTEDNETFFSSFLSETTQSHSGSGGGGGCAAAAAAASSPLPNNKAAQRDARSRACREDEKPAEQSARFLGEKVASRNAQQMHEEESKTQIDSQKVITEPPLKTEKPQDGENDDDPAAESDGTLTQCVVHENVSGSLLQEMPQCSMTPDSMSVSCSGFEPEEGLDTSKQTRSLPFAPPENLLKVVDDKKEGLSDGKAEDRQSKTPSPSACAHSSGTSSTSDIEVLDHDSVVSETSGGSRTEQKNMLPLVHSFQLSEQFSRDGERVGTLDDTRLYESGSSASTDGFERIDASSLRSLESRSVSEMNSDEEAIPGASAQVLVSTSQGEEPSGSDPDVQQADSDVAEDRERVADLLCTESEETFDFPIVNVQCIDGDVAGAESEKAATSLQGSDVSYEMDRSTTPVYEDSYGGCMLDIVDHAEIAKARTGVEVDAQPAYCSFTEKEMRNEMFQVEEPDKRTVLVDQPDGSPRVQTEKSDRNELHNIVSDLTQRLNTREDQLLTVNKEKARLEEIHDNLQE
uniref:Uncharacterized protein n=1 Tax=Eptatretus burgeri TaxID=7764 RepID=A0A8C4Q7X2_EPTBU